MVDNLAKVAIARKTIDSAPSFPKPISGDHVAGWGAGLVILLVLLFVDIPQLPSGLQYGAVLVVVAVGCWKGRNGWRWLRSWYRADRYRAKAFSELSGAIMVTDTTIQSLKQRNKDLNLHLIRSATSGQLPEIIDYPIVAAIELEGHAVVVIDDSELPRLGLGQVLMATNPHDLYEPGPLTILEARTATDLSLASVSETDGLFRARVKALTVNGERFTQSTVARSINVGSKTASE